jgi:NAD+ kinase
MRVGIYGKEIKSEHLKFAEELFECLKASGCELIAYFRFVERNTQYWSADNFDDTFQDHFDMMRKEVDVLISLGGDGTLLDSTMLVVNSGVPIMGVNFGRLGFLANIAREDIRKAIELLTTGQYEKEPRSVIRLDTQRDLFEGMNFALNELTVSRKDTTAMITVHVYLKDQLLNSYWCDGLIISTPTGSTGYSLSCGGPIIMPGSRNFVLTPIAPHNLTVRPFVLSDQVELRLRVEGRSEEHLVSLDSRVRSITSNDELIVKRANFDIHLVRFEGQTFSETLRNKLMWGIDKRN